MPDLSITYRPLKELIPYARNARTHPPEQIRKLRASLAEYGWTNPMLIADSGMIAGHARLQAAIAMAEAGEPIAGNPDPWKGPTVDLSHLSVDQRRSYVLMDNRSATDSGWDEDTLRLEFTDIFATGADMSLTGFDPGEISAYLVPPAGTGQKDGERELTAAENDMLDVAWIMLLHEWRGMMTRELIPDVVSSNWTPGTLGVLYLRALFLGEDIPRGATLAYTHNRVRTAGDKAGSLPDLLKKAVSADGRALRNSIRWSQQEKPLYDRLISVNSLAIHGHRLPNDFPAFLARDLINEFSPTTGAKILDPCHGWGGRMLGFLLSDAEEYHGFDPAEETSEGVTEMFEDLSALTPLRSKKATLRNVPFESAKLKPGWYDFALTSPPYFDTELYDGQQTSWRTFETFDAWVQGFYRPLLSKVAKALKPNGVFALQVGSQKYPLKQIAIDLAEQCGLVYLESRHTIMVNIHHGTEPDDGEVVVILRKA